MAMQLTSTIGNTPLLELNTINPENDVTILAKQESRNPMGSVKCRVAVAMLLTAEQQGKINKNTHIIEPTSGNTGLGLAFACAAKGMKLTLTMPESMSIERRKLLTHMGANLLLTPAEQGMKGAIAKADEIAAHDKNSFIPGQFSNPANPEIHRTTTGPEIWRDCKGQVDIFVAGVGTGGTITGVSEMLKEKNPDMKTVAVEPADSPVLSGGKPGPHKIQGIGAGFVPDILNLSIIDTIVTITDDEAIETARLLAKREGILCGISSGAAVSAALQLAGDRENRGKTIVVILPDTGERYLSTQLF